jgi:hypothetical protein
MGFYMEIFEARVLGENLYLHQRFTSLAIQNKNIKTNISHPLHSTEKKYNPNFSFFLKEIKELSSGGFST